MSLEAIRETLGSEPWCFLQKDIDDLDRDTIFGCYITRKVVNRGKEKKKRPPRPYRDVFFAHGRRLGKSWLEIEADWQKRPKPKA